MKPRVVILLSYFGNGGAENMVSRLASNLDLSRVEAEVVCIYGQPLGNRLETAITEHEVPIRYIGKGKGFSLTAVARLWKELSNFKPSVIHTHLSAGVYCAPWIIFHKAVMVHTIHNTPEYELIEPKQRVMQVLYQLNKAIPVAISAGLIPKIRAHYRLNTEPELVYNPVDVWKFFIPKNEHKGIQIITVGRMAAQKNQMLLINAVKLLSRSYPDLRLTILGDGPLRDEIKSYVDQENLQNVVRLMGNVNNAEAYFAESDIFALTSIYEGLPLAVLEAMAANLPIISTDVGGVRDIVGDNGILVPSGDLDELVQAIERLMKDKQLRETMGKNSYRHVKHFDSPFIANQYVDLYEKYSGQLRRTELEQ